MQVKTKKWELSGIIQSYDTDEYWVDGEVDDNFVTILKEIGIGKKVTVVIHTCEIK